MTPLKTVLSAPPFYGRLTTGTTEMIASLVDVGKRTLIVALEPDYLFCGIAVKNALEGAGARVDALSLDSPKVDRDVFADFGTVVAVGERAVLDVVRLFVGEDKKIVFVPTTVVFYYAFSPFATSFDGGIIRPVKAKLPDAVLFPVDLVKRFRLKHVADGLSVVAASALWKFDRLAKDVIDGATGDGLAYGYVDDALSALKGVSDKPYRSLIECQIYLSAAVYRDPALDFCADRYAAFVLSKIKPLPEAECRFRSGCYIAAFYARALEKDISFNLVAPDYGRSCLELADILKLPPSVVYAAYSPTDEDKVFKALQRVYSSDLKAQAVKTLRVLDGCKRAYDGAYRGKRKRMDVDLSVAVRATMASAILSDGLMRLFADEGILSLFSS